MKNTIKEIFEALVLPPLVLGAVIWLGFQIFGNPTKDISAEKYLEHHDIQEIVDYYAECGELDYLAYAITKYTDNSFYCLSCDDADDLVDSIYALGYYEGATRENELHAEWEWVSESYDIISEAISNRDLQTIKDYKSEAFYLEDYIDEYFK